MCFNREKRNIINVLHLKGVGFFVSMSFPTNVSCFLWKLINAEQTKEKNCVFVVTNFHFTQKSKSKKKKIYICATCHCMDRDSPYIVNALCLVNFLRIKLTYAAAVVPSRAPLTTVFESLL